VTNSILAFLPECFILLTACTLLLKDFKSNNLRFYITTLLFTLLILVELSPELYGQHFCGMMVLDHLSLFGKDLILSFGLVWCASNDQKDREHTVLFLFSLLGACLLVSSNHMLTAYLSLELHVLPLYAIIALRKNAKLAIEGSLKYFVLGTFASIILLYGMGLMYGTTGALGFDEILSFKDSNSLIFQGCSLFVLVGFLFKLAAVPFHGWVPDVYEGSTNDQVAFMGTVSKIAVFFLLLRLRTLFSLDILPWIAVISILFGSIMALRQQNLRRLLAYSGISQMGFVLLGYALQTTMGYGAAVVYLGIYALALTGLFLGLRNIETLDELKGLFHKNPALAFLIGIMILSFAGIPPIAGFWTKFHILMAVINQGYIFAAIGALVGAVISLVYSLNMLRMMFFEPLPFVTPAKAGGHGNKQDLDPGKDRDSGDILQVALAPRLRGGDKFGEMLLIGIAAFLVFFFLLQTPMMMMVAKCL
jgi:NADH-quinone oxidoreductase subunit N